MQKFAKILASLSLVLSATACGGGYSGFLIPVDTELRPFVAPETDELVEEEEDEEEEEGDYEDYEDEEEESAGTAAPQPPAAK